MIPSVDSSSLKTDFKNGANFNSRLFASFISLLETSPYIALLLKFGFIHKNSLSDFSFAINSLSIV